MRAEQFAIEGVDRLEAYLKDRAERWLDQRIAARVQRVLAGYHPDFSITDTPPTQSQERLLRLLGMTIPTQYIWAAKMLHKAGYRRGGIPRGMTWQATRKLTDEQLLKATKR